MVHVGLRLDLAVLRDHLQRPSDGVIRLAYVLLVGLCATLAGVEQLLDGVLDGRVGDAPQVEHAVYVNSPKVGHVFFVVAVGHATSNSTIGETMTSTRGSVLYTLLAVSREICESSFQTMPFSASSTALTMFEASGFFVCGLPTSSACFFWLRLAGIGMCRMNVTCSGPCSGAVHAIASRAAIRHAAS